MLPPVTPNSADELLKGIGTSRKVLVPVIVWAVLVVTNLSVSLSLGNLVNVVTSIPLLAKLVGTLPK